MSDLADKLAQAIKKRENNINNWVWLNKNGESVRFLDMSIEDLQKAYNHCLDMLYRKSNYKFGKLEVRKNIQKIHQSCNAELLHRYIQHDLAIDMFKTNKDILDYINRFKETNGALNEDSITMMFSNLPKEFETLTIGDLLKACLDACEPINRKLISNEFIMSLGIWLTDEDKKDLTEYDSNGKLRPWIEVMKERLFIDSGYFKVVPTGLNYSELRALLNLETRTKVSMVPSATLLLLRDKILLLLDNDLEYHIRKWTNLKEQIENVANYKGWKLVNKYNDNQES